LSCAATRLPTGRSNRRGIHRFFSLLISNGGFRHG
jgi:hypothetical protein